VRALLCGQIIGDLLHRSKKIVRRTHNNVIGYFRVNTNATGVRNGTPAVRDWT
jgi:hypothetical protein